MGLCCRYLREVKVAFQFVKKLYFKKKKILGDRILAPSFLFRINPELEETTACLDI